MRGVSYQFSCDVSRRGIAIEGHDHTGIRGGRIDPDRGFLHLSCIPNRIERIKDLQNTK